MMGVERRCSKLGDRSEESDGPNSTTDGRYAGLGACRDCTECCGDWPRISSVVNSVLELVDAPFSAISRRVSRQSSRSGRCARSGTPRRITDKLRAHAVWRVMFIIHSFLFKVIDWFILKYDGLRTA